MSMLWFIHTELDILDASPVFLKLVCRWVDGYVKVVILPDMVGSRPENSEFGLLNGV